MGDVVAVVALSVVFVAVLGTAEAASRRWKVEPELARKSVHVSAGVLAAALPLVMSFPAVAVLALLFVPFMVVSRRLNLFPSVHGVERSTLGETYFPLGVLIVALAFPRQAPYAFGVLVMAVADDAAGLAGQRYGHRAYKLVTAWKTYVGSAAFFGVTLLLALLMLGPTPAAIGVALVLTVLEGALGGGTDNVVVPVAAAGLFTLAA